MPPLWRWIDVAALAMIGPQSIAILGRMNPITSFAEHRALGCGGGGGDSSPEEGILLHRHRQLCGLAASRNARRLELHGGVASLLAGESDAPPGCYSWFYGPLSCSAKVHSSLESFDLVLPSWDAVWICSCCTERIVSFAM